MQSRSFRKYAEIIPETTFQVSTDEIHERTSLKLKRINDSNGVEKSKYRKKRPMSASSFSSFSTISRKSTCYHRRAYTTRIAKIHDRASNTHNSAFFNEEEEEEEHSPNLELKSLFITSPTHNLDVYKKRQLLEYLANSNRNMAATATITVHPQIQQKIDMSCSSPSFAENGKVLSHVKSPAPPPPGIQLARDIAKVNQTQLAETKTVTIAVGTSNYNSAVSRDGKGVMHLLAGIGTEEITKGESEHAQRKWNEFNSSSLSKVSQKRKLPSSSCKKETQSIKQDEKIRRLPPTRFLKVITKGLSEDLSPVVSINYSPAPSPPSLEILIPSSIVRRSPQVKMEQHKLNEEEKILAANHRYNIPVQNSRIVSDNNDQDFNLQDSMAKRMSEQIALAKHAILEKRRIAKGILESTLSTNNDSHNDVNISKEVKYLKHRKSMQQLNSLNIIRQKIADFEKRASLAYLSGNQLPFAMKCNEFSRVQSDYVSRNDAHHKQTY